MNYRCPKCKTKDDTKLIIKKFVPFRAYCSCGWRGWVYGCYDIEDVEK